VDKAGNLTCYGHDALHRLTDAGNTGTCRHFRYDTQTPPSGVTVTNTLARQAEAYTDNCSGTKITDEWFGYDADGRLTDVYESTPHSGGYYHTSASYWANGALYQLYGIPSTPGWYYGWLGGAGPGLDGEGRYTRVAAGGSNTDPVPYGSVSYVTSGTTEPIGALTNVSYGSGDSDTFNFDPSTGRKQTYTFSVNSVNDKGTLTWNANGTLGKLVIADGLSGTSDSQTCTYYYDDLARLGGKDSNGYSVDCGSKWSQLFTFDPFGNISKSGTGTFSPTYSTATNQFTAIPGVTVSYDQNGNLLTDNLNTYTWDPNWGNPASINSTKLIYDALGQMVEQQNGSSYTQMLYSPVGKTAIMNGQTLVKAFVSLPGGGTAIYNSSSGSPVYYRHADWLGSSRLTSTASRTVYSDSAYSPYAEQYAPDGTADASFTGQNTDTTSTLYDFTFREHSFTQGRWISPDPAGLRSVDPTSPQSWNRYAYALNNPLSYIDPTGLECVWDDGSYDSNDDPTTGTPASCAKAGGTWVDHSYFQANGLADWSGDPNADIAAYAANNGTKSPARQQCEQKAQQKYANAKAALPGVAGRAGLLGFMVPFWGAAVAGCVGGGLVGGAVGGVGGEAVAGPPGAAAGGTGGFAAGCTAGAVGGMEAAILPSVGTMFVTGGVTYVWEGSVASNDLQIDMAACSQIQ
jgi:RHS repeat-associated protein